MRRFVEQSALNHFRLDEVTAPLGITNRSVPKATEAMRWPALSPIPARLLGSVCDAMTSAQTSQTRKLLGANARSRRLRRHITETIPGQLEHFIASGLEFGYSYDSALVDTASEGPCPTGEVSVPRPPIRALAYRTRSCATMAAWNERSTT